MKKLIALAVTVAFALGTAGLAAAQTPAAKPADTTTKPADMKAAEPKADKKPAKMKTKTANGTVKSASADTIVVAGKEKGKEAEWTFAVDPKTTMKKASKAVTPADLKPGDSVQVKYTDQDGKAVAQSVNVRQSAAAKTMDEKKPAEAKPATK